MRRPAVALLLAALLCAPLQAQAQSVLKLGLPSIPSSFDPHLAVTTPEMIVAREQFMGLTALDAEGKVGPGLAESWTVSSDGLSYSFTLREDARWSDGRALDAGVIVKSLERALDPATAAPFAAQLLTIKNAEGFRLGTLSAGAKLGVSARDRRTVDIVLSQPSQRFLQLLAQPVAAAVPVHRIAAKQPWFAPGNMIVSGAHGLSASASRLEKNPRFFSVPAFDAVELSVFGGLDDAQAAVRDGLIDLALGFTPAPHAERNPRGIIEGEAMDIYQLIINVTKPPLDQREPRHALGMLIDRAEIIKNLRLIGSEPVFNTVPNPTYSPQRAPYARLNRADRRVVAEALLLDLDIPKLRPLTLIHPRGAVHQAIADAAAKSWAELGFKTEVTALPEAAFEQAVLEGRFDFAVAPPWRQSAGPEAVLMLYAQTAGPWNAARYRELTFDQFMAEADAELGAEFYPNFLRQAEGVLIEDQVSLPVLAFPAPAFARAKFGGLAPNAAHAHPLRLLRAPE
jgi:oligopeptide transport system substrate-binding protein